MKEEKFIVLDPSLFTSVGRLQDTLKVLSVLRQDALATSIRVILPSNLFHDFDAILKRKEPIYLYKVYKIWLPFYPRDHIEAIVKQQMTDKRYLDLLNIFFKEYSPTAAEKYVENIKETWRTFY